MLNITLYNTNSDALRVNKTLSAIGSYNCDLLETSTRNAPKITLNASNDIINANYAYIPDYHRYYYVEDVVILDGYRVQLNLSVDRLMSFIQPNVASLVGYVERNENDFNTKLVDDQAIFTNDRTIVTKLITDNDVDVTLDNWKIIGTFNSGLCNTSAY